MYSVPSISFDDLGKIPIARRRTGNPYGCPPFSDEPLEVVDIARIHEISFLGDCNVNRNWYHLMFVTLMGFDKCLCKITVFAFSMMKNEAIADWPDESSNISDGSRGLDVDLALFEHVVLPINLLFSRLRIEARYMELLLGGLGPGICSWSLFSHWLLCRLSGSVR